MTQESASLSSFSLETKVRMRFPRVPERYGHFVFAALQACITTSVTAAVSAWSTTDNLHFGGVWLRSWLISWALIVPVVLAAAHPIRKFVRSLTDAAPTR
jgi:hypothetical protein